MNKTLTEIASAIVKKITKIADVEDIYMIKMDEVREKDIRDSVVNVFIFLYIPVD
jgi:hypothetical protein